MDNVARINSRSRHYQSARLHIGLRVGRYQVTSLFPCPRAFFAAVETRIASVEPAIGEVPVPLRQ